MNTISEGAEAKISLLPEHYFNFPEKIVLNMNDCPDIAQTLCVTATALKIPFEITGLETLKVKETDRLLALINELFKIGRPRLLQVVPISYFTLSHPTLEVLAQEHFLPIEPSLSLQLQA